MKKLALIAVLVTALAAAFVVLRASRLPQQSHAQATASAPAEKALLRVMTANIRIADPKDGINEWPKRRQLLVETLQGENPDIIGLQEVTPAQGAYVFKEMKAYARWPVLTDENAGLIESVNATLAGLNTILYRSERFEFVEGASGPVIAEEPQNNPTENTYYALAVLRDKQKVWPTVIVANIHLRHNQRFAARCAARLREEIATFEKKHAGAQVIVTGDMNADKNSRVYGEFTNVREGLAELKDTFNYGKKKAGEKWGNWHAFTGKTNNEWPTDLIFVAGPMAIQMEAAHVRGEGKDGLWASDHFFVKMGLALK